MLRRLYQYTQVKVWKHFLKINNFEIT